MRSFASPSLRMTSEPRVLSDCNELGEPLEWMRQRVGMRWGSTVVLAEEVEYGL